MWGQSAGTSSVGLRSKTDDEILQVSNAVKFDVLTYPDKLIAVGLPWQATLELDYLLTKTNIDALWHP
jgi:hypothetical protein